MRNQSAWLLLCIVTATAGAQGLPQAIVGKPGALLANGGFDAAEGNIPLGWTAEGNLAGLRIVNSKADRTAGLASLEITGTPTAPAAVRSRRVVAVVGGAYTLSAKVRARQGSPASLSVEFWSFDNKKLAVAVANPADATPTTSPSDISWQTVHCDAVAPEGAAHVCVVIRTAKGEAGVSNWDEVDLRLAPRPYDSTLGTARELFLDDLRIESAVRVGRVVHPAVVTTPVLHADQAWENSAYGATVFKVGDSYRMWYTAYNELPPNYHHAYAESPDGLHWTKPLLGQFDFKGSKNNNMFADDVPLGIVAINPDAAPDRRYLAMTFKTGVVNKTLGYYVSFSADGMHWIAASDKPALLDGDVCNVSFDGVDKQYVATVKKRMFTARTPGIYERSAFVSTSRDGVDWTTPRLAVMGDYADDGAAEAIGGLEAQIYGMPVSRYESTFVAFPWIFSILNYTDGDAAFAGEGPVDVQIASSRDLYRWARPVRTRIIDTGQTGAWDAGATYTAANILVDDKNVRMYYSAFNNGHGGGDANDPNRGKNVGQTAIATWRRDGWVSLTNASLPGLGEPGELTTKPLLFHAATLHLNADVHRNGTIRVEVLDDAGQPIDGFTAAQAAPIEADALDTTVRWSSGRTLADLAGRPVKLRFALVNADLYSYWVAP